jgi:hypothetical protein
MGGTALALVAGRLEAAREPPSCVLGVPPWGPKWCMCYVLCVLRLNAGVSRRGESGTVATRALTPATYVVCGVWDRVLKIDPPLVNTPDTVSEASSVRLYVGFTFRSGVRSSAFPFVVQVQSQEQADVAWREGRANMIRGPTTNREACNLQRGVPRVVRL